MSSELKLRSVVGFGGSINNGLIHHPDNKTLLYPLGSTIVIREMGNNKNQEFLQGHSDEISCLALSKSGKYLATGQVTYMGFTADIIIWDLENRKLLHRMSLHKVKVQALSFSCDEQYLASLGGHDDNSLVLWDVASGTAVCGSPTDSNFTQTVKFYNNSNNMLVTAGSYNLHVWDYDKFNNKLKPHDVQLGQMQRVFSALSIDDEDEFVYCGTQTGDVLQVSLSSRLFKSSGPGKNYIPQGVSCTALAPSGHIIVGGGDGTVTILDKPAGEGRLQVLSAYNVSGKITSIEVSQKITKGTYSFYIGTDNCDIHQFRSNCSTGVCKQELIQSSHCDKVNCLAFPVHYSGAFATCSKEDIRVWHLDSCRELLRIKVPNLECNCIAFTADGSSIVSGWSDGAIRGFAPQTGKILFTINDAHLKAVTAIVSTSDSRYIISGGEEGCVRVWEVSNDSQVMVASIKEHKGAVNSIKMKGSSDDECVSASSDGSCIIWDLTSFKRKTSLFANTFFTEVLYHPDESQLVTTGTDRKITYWDAFEGQAIRILDASETAQMNSLDIDSDGEILVSGGGDKTVKVWGYDEGHCYFTGHGHSSSISQVVVSPDRSSIVSVGYEGAVLVWDFPEIPK